MSSEERKIEDVFGKLDLGVKWEQPTVDVQEDDNVNDDPVNYDRNELREILENRFDGGVKLMEFRESYYY